MQGLININKPFHTKMLDILTRSVTTTTLRISSFYHKHKDQPPCKMKTAFFPPIISLTGIVLANPPIIACDAPGQSSISNFNFTSSASIATETLTSVYWEISGFGITCAQANATTTDRLRYPINCTINTSVEFQSWLTFSDSPGLEDTLDPSFFLYAYCDPYWYKRSYQGIFKFKCETKDEVKRCIPLDGSSAGVIVYDSRRMLGPPEGA